MKSLLLHSTSDIQPTVEAEGPHLDQLIAPGIAARLAAEPLNASQDRDRI
jgi:hypothetical protein